MKFRDKRTGAIYEPTDEVAAMMAQNVGAGKHDRIPVPDPGQIHGTDRTDGGLRQAVF